MESDDCTAITYNAMVGFCRLHTVCAAITQEACIAANIDIHPWENHIKLEGCDEKVRGTAESGYKGCQSITRAGNSCLAWHQNGLSGMSNGFNEEHSYCRNPMIGRNAGGQMMRTSIWCWVSQHRWEYCDELPKYVRQFTYDIFPRSCYDNPQGGPFPPCGLTQAVPSPTQLSSCGSEAECKQNCCFGMAANMVSIELHVTTRIHKCVTEIDLLEPAHHSSGKELREELYQAFAKLLNENVTFTPGGMRANRTFDSARDLKDVRIASLFCEACPGNHYAGCREYGKLTSETFSSTGGTSGSPVVHPNLNNVPFSSSSSSSSSSSFIQTGSQTGAESQKMESESNHYHRHYSSSSKISSDRTNTFSQPTVTTTANITGGINTSIPMKGIFPEPTNTMVDMQSDAEIRNLNMWLVIELENSIFREAIKQVAYVVANYGEKAVALSQLGKMKIVSLARIGEKYSHKNENGVRITSGDGGYIDKGFNEERERSIEESQPLLPGEVKRRGRHRYFPNGLGKDIRFGRVMIGNEEISSGGINSLGGASKVEKQVSKSSSGEQGWGTRLLSALGGGVGLSLFEQKQETVTSTGSTNLHNLHGGSTDELDIRINRAAATHKDAKGRGILVEKDPNIKHIDMSSTVKPLFPIQPDEDSVDDGVVDNSSWSSSVSVAKPIETYSPTTSQTQNLDDLTNAPESISNDNLAAQIEAKIEETDLTTPGTVGSTKHDDNVHTVLDQSFHSMNYRVCEITDGRVDICSTKDGSKVFSFERGPKHLEGPGGIGEIDGIAQGNGRIKKLKNAHLHDPRAVPLSLMGDYSVAVERTKEEDAALFGSDFSATIMDSSV